MCMHKVRYVRSSLSNPMRLVCGLSLCALSKSVFCAIYLCCSESISVCKKKAILSICVTLCARSRRSLLGFPEEPFAMLSGIGLISKNWNVSSQTRARTTMYMQTLLKGRQHETNLPERSQLARRSHAKLPDNCSKPAGAPVSATGLLRLGVPVSLLSRVEQVATLDT